MDLELGGRKVLITGASKGIGFACAKAFAAEGADVTLVARTAADLADAADAIRAKTQVTVATHSLDLSESQTAATLARVAGDADILVNNAGAIPRGSVLQLDDARWREAWDLKVFGYINLTRAFYGLFRARGNGTIVNIIGAAGERPMADYIAGSAGNASLMAFTKALGGQSLKDGIRVTGINPGLIFTERLERGLRYAAEQSLGDAERWRELIPADPPPGTPEQVADLTLFLASTRAAHITGTIVTIDGGASAR